MSKRKLLIQVYSDIHIELWNKMPEIPVMAKYLFLAGDIIQLNHPLFYKFFDYCSANWEKVFYTPGTHEFYSKKKNYNEINFEYKLRLQESYKNIYYLNNESVQLNDEIDIYGSVFWTFPEFTSIFEAKMFTTDYNNITYFKKEVNKVVPLDINYVKQLSNESFNLLQIYLNQSSNKNSNKKTIIMTHFPPLKTGTINPINPINDNPLLINYLSWNDETTNNFNLSNVPIWISGHTHWSYNIKKKGCNFIGNQIGYKSEIGSTGLIENGIFEFDLYLFDYFLDFFL